MSPSSLLLLALFGTADAARSSGHLGELSVAATGAPKEKFAERFCPSKEVSLDCSDGTGIAVYSAFYNTKKDKACAPLSKGPESCGANFTAELVQRCNGRQSCSVPQGELAHCPSKPWTGSRIVWSCAAENLKKASLAVVMGGDFAFEETEDLEIVEQGRDSDDLELETLDTEEFTRYKYKFCTESDAVIGCYDDETTKIVLAGYSRWPDQRCTYAQLNINSCYVDAEGNNMGTSDCGCDMDDTKMVSEICDGKTTCVIEPKDIRFCSKDPFLTLYVMWDCIPKLEAAFD